MLRRIGTAADEDEELRKAAWRGLRRSKRARRKAGGARRPRVTVMSHRRRDAATTSPREPATHRGHAGRLAYAGVSSPGHRRGGRPARAGRQPPARPGPARGAASRTRCGSARRWPRSTPSSAATTATSPRTGPPTWPIVRMRAAVGRPGRLAGAAGVLRLAPAQRPDGLRDPRPGRHGPPRPGLLRGLQQGRGDLRQARHRPRRASTPPASRPTARPTSTSARRCSTASSRCGATARRG